MRKYWLTIILFILFVTLLIYVIYTSKNKQDNQNQSQVLFNLDKTKISSIILDSASHMEFKKSGDKYQLFIPEKVPTIQSKVEQLFDAASKVEYVLLISQNETNFEQFGLINPQATVGININDGSKKTLIIGKQTPSQDGYYSKEEGTNNVYKLDWTFTNQFMLGSDEFIDRNTFASFDKDKVDKVELFIDNLPKIFEKKDNSWWYDGKQLDMAKANQLMDKLRDITVDGISSKDQYVGTNESPNVKIIIYQGDVEVFNAWFVKKTELSYNIIKTGEEVQFYMSEDSFEMIKNSMISTFNESIISQ